MQRLFLVAIFVAMIFCAGCPNKKYIEIKSIEQFNALEVNKIEEIDIKSTMGHGYLDEPDLWFGIYQEIFPIKDSKKINTIMTYIRYSNPEGDYTKSSVICFKQGNCIYFMGVEVDSNRVYGEFWSSWLLKDYLLKLGLLEPLKAADSNSPMSFPPTYIQPAEYPLDKESDKFIFKYINSEDPNEKALRKATLDKMQNEVNDILNKQ
jgi:hypothetical protein